MIQEYQVPGAKTEIISQILGLRAKCVRRKRNLLRNMDVKSAFRQVGVPPDRATAFVYRLEGLVLVNLRPQFGWHRSPLLGGMVASAIQEANRATTWASAMHM